MGLLKEPSINPKIKRKPFFFTVSLLCHGGLLGILAMMTERVEPQTRLPMGPDNVIVLEKKPAVFLPTVLQQPKAVLKKNQKRSPRKYLGKTAERQNSLLELTESDAAPQSSEALALDGRVFRERPVLLNGDFVKVPYPKKALYLKVQGVVRLKLTVSEDGQVIDARILSGPAFGMQAAALTVARQLSFLPATDEKGQGKTAEIEHEVVFRLN